MAIEPLTTRISSNKKDLNELNKKYFWIPNELTIRPSETILAKKQKLFEVITNEWRSVKDFILHTIFDQKVSEQEGKKLVSEISELINNWVFKPSDFRYNIPSLAYHYNLWNYDKDISHEYDDEEINEILRSNIKKILNTDKFQFAWYKNPKPTVPDFYHLQVFFIKG